MYAIVTTEEGYNIKLIGPFASRQAAERYAKRNKYWGVSICVLLSDSDNAIGEPTVLRQEQA